MGVSYSFRADRDPRRTSRGAHHRYTERVGVTERVDRQADERRIEGVRRGDGVYVPLPPHTRGATVAVGLVRLRLAGGAARSGDNAAVPRTRRNRRARRPSTDR